MVVMNGGDGNSVVGGNGGDDEGFDNFEGGFVAAEITKEAFEDVQEEPPMESATADRF